jgi:hypothetical protein
MLPPLCILFNQNPHLRSLDATQLDNVCVSLAKPMKKAVRKTVEEAVFLVYHCTSPIHSQLSASITSFMRL